MGKSLIVFSAVFLVSMQAASAQRQRIFDVLSDFGDGTTQTFTAESNDMILGVSLVVFGHGNAADTTIHIRDLLSDGSLDSEVLASGVLSAQDVPTDVAGWRFIAFDKPFELVQNEDYGLVVNQFNSGSSGFNDYGASLADPYGNGELRYELSAGRPLLPLNPTADLAFVVVPEPTSMKLAVLLIGAVVLRLRHVISPHKAA